MAILLARGLKEATARNTIERVAGLDDFWGGSFQMKLGFKSKSRLMPSARGVVLDVCREFVESDETISHLVTAVQELLENLVKYSELGRGVLEFELLVLDGRHTARIRTINQASPSHLAEATQMLERIVAAPDPHELFQSLIASSGERKGSGLGLARLAAESGLSLSYSVQHGHLHLEARRTVQPRWSDA